MARSFCTLSIRLGYSNGGNIRLLSRSNPYCETGVQFAMNGEGTSGPLGTKKIAIWLNERGYRTRKGSLFGTGTVAQMTMFGPPSTQMANPRPWFVNLFRNGAPEEIPTQSGRALRGLSKLVPTRRNEQQDCSEKDWLCCGNGALLWLSERANRLIRILPRRLWPVRGCGGGARWMPRNDGDPHDESQSEAARNEQTTCLKIGCHPIR
jgi:hypothetical protein